MAASSVEHLRRRLLCLNLNLPSTYRMDCWWRG